MKISCYDVGMEVVIMNELKLFKQRVTRDGKRYTNLYLVWEYKGKLYDVRIKPCFDINYTVLLGVAEKQPSTLEEDK